MNAGGQGRPFLHALSRDFNFQRLGNLSRLLRLPRGEQIGFLRRGYEQKRRLRGIKAEVNPAIHAREIAIPSENDKYHEYFPYKNLSFFQLQ